MRISMSICSPRRLHNYGSVYARNDVILHRWMICVCMCVRMPIDMHYIVSLRVCACVDACAWIIQLLLFIKSL